MKTWLGVLTPVCIGLLASGETVPPTQPPLDPSGEWEFHQSAEACRASRSFGSESDRVILKLSSFGPGSSVEVTVQRADLPKEPWSVRLAHVGWEGDVPGRYQLAVLASSGGVPTATVLTSYRDDSTFFKGAVDQTVIGSTTLDLNSRTLNVRVVGSGPIALNTGPLADVVRRMSECETSLLGKWGWESGYPQLVASGPEIIHPSSLTPIVDYPAPMVVNRISNFVQLRLKIDLDGKVAECVVQSSPASKRFGNDTCKTIRRKIRYTPARDRQGQAVEGYAHMTIIFAVMY